MIPKADPIITWGVRLKSIMRNGGRNFKNYHKSIFSRLFFLLPLPVGFDKNMFLKSIGRSENIWGTLQYAVGTEFCKITLKCMFGA